MFLKISTLLKQYKAHLSLGERKQKNRNQNSTEETNLEIQGFRI